MANTHLTLASLFEDTANAIRERAGSTEQIVADTFPTVIRNIPKTIVQSSKTVTPSTSKQTITPDSGYDALAQVIVNAINGKVVKTGVYTPTSSASGPNFTVTHNLGVLPDICICFIEDLLGSNTPGSDGIFDISAGDEFTGYINGIGFYPWIASSPRFYGRQYDYTKSFTTLYNEMTTKYGATIFPTCVYSVTTSKATFGHGSESTYNHGFSAGRKYRWIIGKFY